MHDFKTRKDFMETILKFSPYIKKVAEEIYPTPEALKKPSWHSWTIPPGTTEIKLLQMLKSLLGEYIFLGAYAEEISSLENHTIGRELLYIKSTFNVHVFLFCYLDTTQHQLLKKIVQSNNLTTKTLNNNFIEALDNDCPPYNAPRLNPLNIEKLLRLNSY